MCEELIENDDENKSIIDYHGYKIESKIVEGLVSRWISKKIIKSFRNFMQEI